MFQRKDFVLQQIYTSELKLVTSSVKVVTSSRLDRESRADYQLSISCRDFGTTALTSVITVNVKVERTVHCSLVQRSVLSVLKGKVLRDLKCVLYINRS